jgi:TRAP-type C4-dicarboxylate transport system permease small subunit
MKFLNGFNEIVNRVLEKMLIAGFAVMTGIIFLQIIFRYVFAASLSWSEEVARYLFVWLTFLGASVVAKSRSHITVESIVDAIKSEIVRKSLKTLADVLVLVFLWVLVYEGFAASFEILELEQISPSMPWLSLGWIYFAIPLGSLFMALNIIQQILDRWRGPRDLKEDAHHG